MRVSLAIIALTAVATAIGADTAGVLSIQDLTISQADGGAGVEGKFRFRAGEQVHITFKIAGFAKKEDEDEHDHLKLEFTITAKDVSGILLSPPLIGKIE